MKREIATMGLIIPFIAKCTPECTPESKFDAIELEIYDESGKTVRVFMDQISIKTINEYPDGEKIILSIDMRSLKHLQDCFNSRYKANDEKQTIEFDHLVNESDDGYVDMEEMEDIYKNNKTDKKDIKTVDANVAIQTIKKSAEALSSMYPSEKDFCTDEWPGNKYIITPDQC